MQKCLNWKTCLSKEVYCNKGITDGGLGAEPLATGDYGGLSYLLSYQFFLLSYRRTLWWAIFCPAAGQFFVIFWKKKHFITIGSHFPRIQSHLKVLDF